ncbi:MAG: phosphoribosylformylglycinamidine synthase subunit PurQ [Candidatus Thorarchaeota archaeon]
MRTLVLRVDGTNCAQETLYALKLAGSIPTLAHINELLRNRLSLENFDGLVIPGGFAYGDHIAAGKVLASILRYRLRKEISNFVKDNKPILGICNGFQALIKANLLDVDATLGANDSGLFIDRWITLNRVAHNRFSENIDNLFIPINHGEGKFIATEKTLDRLEIEKRVVFKYKENPNGSHRDIAGIVNHQGNVIGLMPHPEKFVHYFQHPSWTRLPKRILANEGQGLQFYRNFVRAGEKH